LSNEGIFALVTLGVEFTSVSSKYWRGEERGEQEKKGGKEGRRVDDGERPWFFILCFIRATRVSLLW
jgi:hypothetical protein